MSDCIEHDGRKYFEESYLHLANRNAQRKDERIAELERENELMRCALDQNAPSLHEAVLTLGRENAALKATFEGDIDPFEPAPGHLVLWNSLEPIELKKSLKAWLEARQK